MYVHTIVIVQQCICPYKADTGVLVDNDGHTVVDMAPLLCIPNIRFVLPMFEI